MTKLHATAAIAALMAAAGCASTMPAKTEAVALVSPNGMTLYAFANDPAGAGKSVCVDKCAVNWPPLAAASGDQASGDWSVITRNDGSKQWAYKGKPLYYWAKDTKAGDKTGNGVNNLWRTATP